MIRSLLQYSRYFALGLVDRNVRELILAHRRTARPEGKILDRSAALHAIADHFCRAQDHGSDDGLGSFHLIDGWSASYPETTGYIVPTLIAMADHLNRPELVDRAVRAADWLLSIQMKEGGWQGGRVDEQRPPIVFNTAQVVRGMMAAHDRTHDIEFLNAAIRACDWIVSVQEKDGSWARRNFLGASRVYDSYVSAPLLHMHSRTGDPKYREAAKRNLDLIVSKQYTNGWFPDADNTIKHNDRPITHTIAYTIDGLLESHTFLQDERYLKAARSAAGRLQRTFLKEGTLHGRYDQRWKGSEFPITTGNAQLAIVWARLFAITGQPQWKEGVDRMTAWLMAVQQLSIAGPPDAHGAISGSFPLWGRYEKFAFPNWAQKYFADALLCAEGITPRY